jgi:hypothetical protein
MAIGDFDGDSLKEVFIGAPGYSLKGYGQLGAVYFSSLDMSHSHPEIKADEPYLNGMQKYSRFGYSVVAIDLNRDGTDDLVVSSPAFGPGGSTDIGDYYAKNYYGRLHVYLGIKGFGIKKGASPDFTIKSRTEDDIFMNLGQNLRVSDCNGDGMMDLIIMSPMSQQKGDKRGHVAVFYEFMSRIQQGELNVEDADLVLTGTDNYQWFGFDAVCTNDHTLIVGSPGKRMTSVQYSEAAGAVYAYSTKDKSLKWTLESDQDQSKFGSSLSFNAKKNLLAVGAPSQHSGTAYHSGAAYVYNLASSNMTFANF